METTIEPEVITELRKRVAKANELSKFNREIGFENRGNHALGAFLTGVLREYDKVVNENIVLKGDVKEWKLFYEDIKTSHSYLHRVVDDIATALGYRMAQTYEPQLLVKKVKKLVEANRGLSG
jgi:hypothetical protein